MHLALDLDTYPFSNLIRPRCAELTTYIRHMKEMSIGNIPPDIYPLIKHVLTLRLCIQGFLYSLVEL